jgi:hypothetical protein
MACDENIELHCNGTVVISLEAALEEHGDAVGGSVVCRDASGTVRIVLRAASEQFGGTSLFLRDGAVQVANAQGEYRAIVAPGDPEQNQDGGLIRLTASTDSQQPPPAGGPPPSAIVLSASDRSITIRGKSGKPVVTLDGSQRDVAIEGVLRVRDGSGREVLRFESANAALYVGASQNEGDVIVRANNGSDSIHLNGGDGSLHLRAPSAADKDRVTLSGSDGSLRLRGTKSGAVVDRIHVQPDTGNIWLGGNGQDGDVVLFPAGAPNSQDAETATMHLSAGGAHLRVGGNGVAGSIGLFASSPSGIAGADFEHSRIWLSGETGDIRLTAADCAEDFSVRRDAEVEPGAVMVLGADGVLEACRNAYDRKVAGVVAGAGTLRSGIVLDRQPDGDDRLPVALMGKTCCKVDARFGTVRIGDLLTTSPTPGHAMKADDPARAFGAVLGKALGALDSGRGLVPVLVALQ